MRNFGSIHIFYQTAQSKLQIVHNFHSIHIFCQMAQSKSQIVHKHLKIRKMKQVVVSWTIEIQINDIYLFTVTGVKKMKWFLSLTRCHFQPRVIKGHEWLEMAPSEK